MANVCSIHIVNNSTNAQFSFSAFTDFNVKVHKEFYRYLPSQKFYFGNKHVMVLSVHKKLGIYTIVYATLIFHFASVFICFKIQ